MALNYNQQFFMNNSSNIVLVGMPAAGKSTVGKIIADSLGMEFIDTDFIIEEKEDKKLHEIIKKTGIEGFQAVEEAHVLSVSVQRTVISTGGSVVYSDRAMKHLKKNGVAVYLKVPADLLIKRLDDPEKRGVVRKHEQSFQSLLNERNRMYIKYADIIADCKDESPYDTADRVMCLLEHFFTKNI